MVHRKQQADRKLQVLVRAEGPTRVLSITDLTVSHPFLLPHPPSTHTYCQLGSNVQARCSCTCMGLSWSSQAHAINTTATQEHQIMYF